MMKSSGRGRPRPLYIFYSCMQVALQDMRTPGRGGLGNYTSWISLLSLSYARETNPLLSKESFRFFVTTLTLFTNAHMHKARNFWNSMRGLLECSKIRVGSEAPFQPNRWLTYSKVPFILTWRPYACLKRDRPKFQQD